jgi:hydroxypyruvate reductase
MNTVRKHFSRIKGGRLAKAAFPARVVSLVVSDIPGDNPAYVASGPTVPDHANADDALQIIKDYNIVLNQRIIEAMSAANAPRPDDVEFSRNEVRVIASARVSLEAAAADARAKGIDVAMLSDSIEGEAKDIGLMHAAFAREIALQNKPFKKPILLLSGGETSVTIGSAPFGKGGRNTEFLLSFALAIDGVNGVYALAADTDGIDGSENNAGAYCDFSSASRLRAAGLHGRQILLGHDAYRAFHAIGDLFVTGQTGTNVNDFRAVLVV